MDLNNKIIAIGGNARSGKDTLADNFVALLEELDIKAKKVSFAYALKDSVDSFLLKETGISAFTKDLSEKSIIRPFLVCWGTDVMRSLDQDVWVKRLQKHLKPDRINIISDLRFTNELDWVRENKGLSLMLKREGINPANKHEEEQNKKLYKLVDLKFDMANLKEEKMIKCLSYEMLNSLITEEIFDSWKATCPL